MIQLLLSVDNLPSAPMVAAGTYFQRELRAANMRFNLASTFLGIAALMIGQTTATGYPKPPGLKYMYSVNITAGPAYNIGVGPRGNRTVYPIAGGTVSGPAFSGTPSSADVKVAPH
jgi:hypothetical protein